MASESSRVQRLIGASMRLYRASPMYPRLGRTLGKVLGVVTRRRAEPVIREIDGVKFELDLREVIDASLYYSGTFEAHAERAITGALAPGMVAVDIGANLGYHTFRMAKAVGATGKVVAIEPTGWAFRKLTRNLELNSFTNIQPIKVGLSDRDVGPTQVRFQASYRLDGTDLSAEETVQIDTLDTVLARHGVDRVDFIKLDVDGYEGKVFRGAKQTLERHHPILFFELTPSAMRTNGDDPVELLEALVALGYQLRTEQQVPIAEVRAYVAGMADGYSENLLAVPAS